MKKDDLNTLFFQYSKDLAEREKKRKKFQQEKEKEKNRRKEFRKNFTEMINRIVRPEMKKIGKLFKSQGFIVAFNSSSSDHARTMEECIIKHPAEPDALLVVAVIVHNNFFEPEEKEHLFSIKWLVINCNDEINRGVKQFNSFSLKAGDIQRIFSTGFKSLCTEAWDEERYIYPER